MTQVRARSLIVPLALLLACGGGDEGDPFSSNKFAGMHMDKVIYDCDQAVACDVQTGAPLEENPHEGCYERTARSVNDSSSSERQQYLTNYNRCAHFVACVYVNCADTDAASYGESQRDKVTYDCQQEVACMTQQGTFVGDAAIAVQNCVTANIMRLDDGAVFNSTNKREYERRFGECLTLAACEFMACFPY